jgi:KUP system potassium uptake protein
MVDNKYQITDNKKQKSDLSIGLMIFVGLIILLLIYSTNINAGRANKSALLAIRTIYNGQDGIDAYNKALLYPSPHVDDIRNDFTNDFSLRKSSSKLLLHHILSTSILFANFLVSKRTNPILIYLYLFVYIGIEICFLIANLEKFPFGGYVTLVIGGFLFGIMFVWFKSRKIKNRYVEFVKMDEYIHMLQDLSNDLSIPKYATHLVYLTSANNPHEIEHKIIYSILNKKPKRADIYWFVHVDVLDEPYRTDYVVDAIIPNEIIRIEFRLGFREEHRINLMFRKVVEDMVKNKEVNITSRYTSLQRNKVAGDWQFIVMEKFLSHDNDLPLFERVIMRLYFLLKKFSLSEEKGFGLDSSFVTVEKFPLVVSPVSTLNLRRIEKDVYNEA